MFPVLLEQACFLQWVNDAKVDQAFYLSKFQGVMCEFALRIFLSV